MVPVHRVQLPGRDELLVQELADDVETLGPHERTPAAWHPLSVPRLTVLAHHLTRKDSVYCVPVLRIPVFIGSVDPDLESISGSRGHNNSLNRTNEKMSCFEVLDVLSVEASPGAWPSHMKFY
jgi:hypothetical protein